MSDGLRGFKYKVAKKEYTDGISTKKPVLANKKRSQNAQTPIKSFDPKKYQLQGTHLRSVYKVLNKTSSGSPWHVSNQPSENHLNNGSIVSKLNALFNIFSLSRYENNEADLTSLTSSAYNIIERADDEYMKRHNRQRIYEFKLNGKFNKSTNIDRTRKQSQITSRTYADLKPVRSNTKYPRMRNSIGNSKGIGRSEMLDYSKERFSAISKNSDETNKSNREADNFSIKSDNDIGLQRIDEAKEKLKREHDELVSYRKERMNKQLEAECDAEYQRYLHRQLSKQNYALKEKIDRLKEEPLLIKRQSRVSRDPKLSATNVPGQDELVNIFADDSRALSKDIEVLNSTIETTRYQQLLNFQVLLQNVDQIANTREKSSFLEKIDKIILQLHSSSEVSDTKWYSDIDSRLQDVFDLLNEAPWDSSATFASNDAFLVKKNLNELRHSLISERNSNAKRMSVLESKLQNLDQLVAATPLKASSIIEYEELILLLNNKVFIMKTNLVINNLLLKLNYLFKSLWEIAFSLVSAEYATRLFNNFSSVHPITNSPFI